MTFSSKTLNLIAERRRLTIAFNAAPEDSPEEEKLLQQLSAINQQIAQQPDYRRRTAADNYGVAYGLLATPPPDADA